MSKLVKEDIPIVKVFEQLFCLGLTENRLMLLSFLNAVFENSLTDPIYTVACDSPYQRDRHLHSVTGINLRARTFLHQDLLIRLQFREESFYRSPCYYTDQFVAEHTNQLDPQILIILVNFNLLQETSDYHTYYPMRPAQWFEPHPPTHTHYLELPKLNVLKPERPLEQWLYFIRYIAWNKRTEGLAHLITKDNVFKIASSLILDRYSQSVESDWPDYIRDAKPSHQWDGWIGSLERECMALRMIKRRYPYKQIVDLTGLSEQQLDRLALDHYYSNGEK